jgi:hypothetical protein
LRRFCCLAALIFVMVLGTVSVTAAQDQSNLGKNEIAGTFGHAFVSNQGVLNSGLPNPVITFGAGYTFEVNYARILLDREWFDFGVEIPAIFDRDEDLHYPSNQIPQGYSSTFITPAARVRLIPTMAFSPWFSLGGGFGHFGSSSNLIYGGGNAGSRGATSGVLQGGIGLDVRIPCECAKHFKIRVEARDNWSGVPSLNVNTGKTRQHNFYVGAGVVYRF